MPAFLVGLVVFQGLLGMWTVTLLLKPLIVSAHLIGGLTTMALLWWMSLAARRARTRPHGERTLRKWAVVGLGGAGAADHAGRLGQLELRRRGVPGFSHLPGARTGRTWISRMRSCCGAGSASTTRAACWTIRRASPFISRTGSARSWRRSILGFVAMQGDAHRPIARGARGRRRARGGARRRSCSLGPIMVLKTFPLPLATAHNAVAALLLLSMVALLRFLFPPRDGYLLTADPRRRRRIRTRGPVSGRRRNSTMPPP